MRDMLTIYEPKPVVFTLSRRLTRLLCLSTRVTVVHGPFHVLFEMERNRGRRTRRRFCMASVHSSRLTLPLLQTVRRRWEKRRRIEERSQLPHSPVFPESAVVAAQQDITRRLVRYYLQGIPGTRLHAHMMKTQRLVQ